MSCNLPGLTHGQEAVERWPDLLAAAIITCIMSGAVSGLATARTLGLVTVLASPAQWLGDWGRAFVLAWPMAFAIFSFVAPAVRRQVARLAGRS